METKLETTTALLPAYVKNKEATTTSHKSLVWGGNRDKYEGLESSKFTDWKVGVPNDN